jgi:hypothetical protein
LGAAPRQRSRLTTERFSVLCSLHPMTSFS